MHFGTEETGDNFFLATLVKYLISKSVYLISAGALCFILAIFYSLQLPNIYQSEALLAPTSNESANGNLASLAGQFGGLASMAGINLGGSNQLDKTKLAISILKSKHFTNEFIEKRGILPELMAAKAWDMDSNTIIYDEELYDTENNKWVRVVEKPLKPRPSLQEAYEVFIEIVEIKEDADVGVFTLSVEHVSPYTAKLWVDWLIEDINELIKKREMDEALRSSEYLHAQLEETQVEEMRDALYRLIEEQAKTVMLAQVREEYVFQTIDPALVPEKKLKPSRALICILGGIIGFVLMALCFTVRFCIGIAPSSQQGERLS
jgi:uncharacterized protein involved in exopolysaccharide biosynthesis